MTSEQQQISQRNGSDEDGHHHPMDRELGEAICERTPYESMRLAEHWQDGIEWDEQRILWSFRGVDSRVGRAIRIPVIITHKGEEYKDWLLIGYEGSGGY